MKNDKLGELKELSYQFLKKLLTEGSPEQKMWAAQFVLGMAYEK